MAKFVCVCGKIISTSDHIPNPNEWRCMSDIALSQFESDASVEDLYLENWPCCLPGSLDTWASLPLNGIRPGWAY